MQCSIINYSHHVAHYSMTYLFYNCKFVPFDSIHPFNSHNNYHVCAQYLIRCSNKIIRLILKTWIIQDSLNKLVLTVLKIHQGFPGGAVVESLTANAGDTGSSPGLGGSHMPRSNWAREPQLLSLRVWSLCSATGGAAIVRGPHTTMKSGPRLLQLEKALAQKRRPNTTKNKIN